MTHITNMMNTSAQHEGDHQPRTNRKAPIMHFFLLPDLTGPQVFHAVADGRHVAFGIAAPVVTRDELHRILTAARVA